MKQISILHPSFKRPELSKQCYDTWMERCCNPEGIEYVLCLSEKDPTLSQYDIQFEDTSVIKVIIKDNGLVKQCNAAAEQSIGNLLIAISDDFSCPNHWDTVLLTSLEGKEDYVVKTQDGLQPYIITLPIMDRKYYSRFGHIYHPDYNHMYGDEEIADIGKMLNRTIVLNVYFRHNHYSTGINPKDEVNVKNDSFFMVDKETFLIHRSNNFGIVLLSILIATIDKREGMLKQLTDNLKTQIGNKPVEILIEPGDYLRIGQKRNSLLVKAKGEYVVFFDDDDVPADHYVYSILGAIRSNPDCCNLNGIITTDGKNPKRFEHSIKHKEWFEKEEVYYRPPNHLNAIKRSIAAQFTFPEINFGEDKDYSMQLSNSGLLKTEAVIDETLYFYKYITTK